MRITPRPAAAVVVFVAYCALVAAVWAVNDVDYGTVADSSGNVVRGIVVPIGLGALLLVIVTTWLGWWRPAMLEEHRAGLRWAMLIPALLAVTVIAGMASIDFGSTDAEILPLIALGCLFVGFSEELLTRGLMLVGLRGSLRESWVWFLSSLSFGLLHGLNAFYGQSVKATAGQIGFAFAMGTAFYVTRRVIGALLVTMVIHALWDFGTLGTDATDGTALPFGAPVSIVAVVLSFVVLVKLVRTTPSTARGLAPSSA
ncbi:MAG: CPBP family intramembrane glutamic endopeptidase [Actinomycetes bacterium]